MENPRKSPGPQNDGSISPNRNTMYNIEIKTCICTTWIHGAKVCCAIFQWTWAQHVSQTYICVHIRVRVLPVSYGRFDERVPVRCSIALRVRDDDDGDVFAVGLKRSTVLLWQWFEVCIQFSQCI